MVEQKQQALVDKAEAQLAQADAEIDRLQAKAKEANADARLAMNEQIEDLKSKRDDAAGELEKLKQTSADAWRDVKIGAERAWSSLSHALDRAKDRFAA